MKSENFSDARKYNAVQFLDRCRHGEGLTGTASPFETSLLMKYEKISTIKKIKIKNLNNKTKQIGSKKDDELRCAIEREPCKGMRVAT